MLPQLTSLLSPTWRSSDEDPLSARPLSPKKGGSLEAVEARLADVATRVRKLEDRDGLQDGMTLSSRLDVLEQILQKIGSVERAKAHNAAARSLNERLAVLSKMSIEGRTQEIMDKHPGMRECKARQKIEDDDAQMYQLAQEASEVKAADIFFTGLSNRLAGLERKTQEQERALAQLRRECEASTHSNLVRARDFARDFEKANALLDERTSGVETRVKAVEADTRQCLLWYTPVKRGSQSGAALSESPREQGPYPITGEGTSMVHRLRQLDTWVGDLQLQMEHVQEDLQRVQKQAGQLETKTLSFATTMETRMEGVEDTCKSVNRKLQSRSLRKQRTFLDVLSRRGYAAPALPDPKDEPQLPLRMRTLEQSLLQLGRRFEGFMAELNGLPLLEDLPP